MLGAMETRAIHLFWWQTLQAPERMLDDLARHTDINTLILDAAYVAVEDPAAVPVLTRVYGESYLVPSTAPFVGATGAVAEEADYAAALGFMDLARSRGFTISCHVLPLNPNAPAMARTACIDVTGAPALDEDVTGARDLGGAKFAHACPNHPEAQRFGEALVRAAIAAWPGLERLDLNHLEFPHWPRTGLAELFVCFCDSCRDSARAQGLDFEAMKREVADLHQALARPATRVRQRCRSTTSPPPSPVARNSRYGSTSASPRCRPTSSVWRAPRGRRRRRTTPASSSASTCTCHAICALVGTDLDLCGRLFDWVSPKFPDYMPGSVIPMAAQAIAAAGRFDEAELRQGLRDLCDLGPGPAEYVATAMDEEGAVLYPNAYDPGIIARQMPHLAALRGKMPLYAWTWLDNRDHDGWRRKFAALRESGLDGYFLWCWESDLTPEALAASKGIF